MANQTEKRQAAAKASAKTAVAEADTETDETVEGDDGKKPVAQQIREMAEAGKSRREIADAFSVSYQRVYQVTKGMDVYQNGEGGGGQRPRVLVEASEALTKAGYENLVGMPRVEAIRSLYDQMVADGVEKPIGKIAKLLGCSYQIVFQATKAQRATDEVDEGEAEELEEGEEAEGELEESEEDEDEESEDTEEA